MTTCVVDASALLRFLDREPGYIRIAELLKEASRGDIELLISAVNWGEVVSVLYKAHGLALTRTTLSRLRTLPIDIVPVDAEDAESAAIFRQDHKLPYADAFAGALALLSGSSLVTADFDFRSAERAIQVEFLPKK